MIPVDLTALLAADDRIPAYLELEQDLVFPHLAPKDRLHYVEYSLRVGREQAAEYQGMSVTDLARQVGATVTVVDTENRFGGVTIRAEHDAGTGAIKLYEPSIVQVMELLNRALPEPWTRQQVMDLHAAHELFHHLEATAIQPVHEQLPAVVTFRLGRLWQTRSRARRCREIAAHAFAKELLGLPFLPNAVDWLVLLSMGKWSHTAFAESLERAREAITVPREGIRIL